MTTADEDVPERPEIDGALFNLASAAAAFDDLGWTEERDEVREIVREALGLPRKLRAVKP